ncbi:HU family DNA-binding protein [Caldovatus aquaticus]|uniref:HU family DNA-binding protein n=1 Tax=Caldovatus aquaticus TaxID=2865671 RepID=A0ABS7F1M2_9PROT|nr:HU family DNA-binding protein [Caldovatus aquaticus]MBW8269499.1 HU family DNA-binding protein [Caldovatus aquaticus]
MAEAAKEAATTGKAGAAPAAVGLRQIAAELAEEHEMPRRQVEAILNDFVAAVTNHLKAGAKVRLGGIGIFQVRERPARIGRNPATGAQIQIPASRKIAFRPAKELKEAV